MFKPNKRRLQVTLYCFIKFVLSLSFYCTQYRKLCFCRSASSISLMSLFILQQYGLFEFHCIYDELNKNAHAQHEQTHTHTQTNRKNAGFWYLFIRAIAFCFVQFELKPKNQNNDKTLHRFHWSNTSCCWIWTYKKCVFFSSFSIAICTESTRSFIFRPRNLTELRNQMKYVKNCSSDNGLAADPTNSTKNNQTKQLVFIVLC